jgi:Leucine-rich repeat (LRR) protein
MKKQRKNSFLYNEDEIYAEAQRLIKECREKGKKKLDLSHLSLKVIPQEIAELKTLTELDITGYSLAKIPDFIGNISSLKRLSIGYRHSSPHDRENVIIPDTLGSLKNLQWLYLGYRIQEIPGWLWELDNLNGLTICNDTIETIPDSIGNLKKLHSLRIHGEKISELPDGIGNLRSLQSFEIECLGLKTLPPSFSNLKKLKKFYLLCCNFSSIPDYICGLTELLELNITMDNSFQGPYTDFTKIPEHIGNLKKLQILKLDGTGIRKIPVSLGECPLEQLAIAGDFKTIPETFGNLSKLKELKLYAYKLRTLPESFGNLSSLENLDLYGGVTELPASFGNLSSLKDLSFGTQGITLPETFGNLSSLQHLSITDSKITSLPKSIGKCTNLKRLYLDCDELQELPASIGNLKNLEEFHADVFNLKKIPGTIGNFTELKSLNIFSGALTAIPESLGNLKKLKTLTLDAYNVHKLPESLKIFSYIKYPNINIGRTERESTWHLRLDQEKCSAAAVAFDELKYMSYQYRWKVFEKYSLKELEALLCSVPYEYDATEIDKEIVGDILRERLRRLNRRFSWTRENILRIAKVSDAFLAAWEEGFVKAKSMIDMLYERETDKDSFWNNYDVEIILEPNIFAKNEKTGEWDAPDSGAYSVLTDYLNPESQLTIDIGDRDYNPATKDEKGFREHIHINHDLSWNIEGFGDIDLKNQYICYAIHILYSHNEWANEDILRINNIYSEVKVTHRDKGEVL